LQEKNQIVCIPKGLFLKLQLKNRKINWHSTKFCCEKLSSLRSFFSHEKKKVELLNKSANIQTLVNTILIK
jgi:hypothetical protein